MSFEVSGKIIAVLDKKSGVSNTTGSQWSAQQYVIETKEQYPKRLCFEVFGEECYLACFPRITKKSW